MAKLGRWIEPKPPAVTTEHYPLLLVPVTRQSSIAIPTQIVPSTIIIDGQSLQSNMNLNREALRAKLARRPTQGLLVQRGILPAAEGGDGSRATLRVNDRDLLRRKIEQRPSKQKLVTQHILLSASNADPLIQTRAELLKRCKLKDKLNRKLQHRPGPLELVTKKILQADAELEQAIQEGRLLFTKTTEGSHSETACSLPDSAMEVIVAPTVCPHQPKTSGVCGSSKSRFRKKSLHQYRSPYDQPSQSSSVSKPKLKLQDYKEAPSNGYKVTSHASEAPALQSSHCLTTETLEQANEINDLREVQSSYDLLLQQQQLFLQWQREVEDSRSNSFSEERIVGVGSPGEGSSVREKPSPATSSQKKGEVGMSIKLNSQQHCSTCCQCSSPSNDLSSNVGRSDVEKQKQKLSDYRVQDLKNECKKRQLPVSGAKPQLLERLKPYEDAILCSAPAATSESGPESVSALSPIPNPSSSPNRLPPISNVINDYLQQNIAVQQSSNPVSQQQPVMVHIPAVSQQQQVLHLVDSNGSLVAMATVPTAVQCCCISSDLAGARNATTAATAHVHVGEALRPDAGQPSSDGGTLSFVSAHSQSSSSQPEPTFSFAQLGSGGQFTLVQSSSSSPDGQQTVVRQASVPSPAAVSAQLQHSSRSTASASSGTSHVHAGTAFTTASNPQMIPQQIVSSSSNANAPVHQLSYTQYLVNNVNARTVQNPSPQEVTAVSQRALCPPMQATVPAAGSSPVMADSASDNSPGVPSPTAAFDSGATVSDVSQPQFDASDTNALLSATTLSIHEEMLRFQQRKIEELQKELHRSQQQLKHQQQVILAAKKAQQVKRQEGAREDENLQQSQAEIWLNQLDIKYLNKFHIQLFLQHKLQQQQMQAQVVEQQNLSATEQKLQEELHVEQAVQDIVRLIKQDARTALLIVQLLRRYQLERSQTVAAAAATRADEEQRLDEVEVQQGAQGVPEAQAVEECAGECAMHCSTTTASASVQEHSPPVAANTHHKPKSKKKSAASRSSSSKAENGEHKEKSTVNVDMEEIFRKVLEEASRALVENDAEKTDEASRCALQSGNPPVEQISEQCTFEEFPMHTSSEVQPCSALPSCDHLIQPYAPEKQPGMVFGEQHLMDSDVNDERYQERIEILDEGAVLPAPSYQYFKSQAFDDLMDVLRDDQAGFGDIRETVADFGDGTVYGSDELATLLGDDWFEHDDAMQPTPAYTQINEQYSLHETNDLCEAVNGAADEGVEQKEQRGAMFAQSSISDQNMGMDWLDMMLPSPAQSDLQERHSFAEAVEETHSLG